MTTYSIYFDNQSASKQNYAFFMEEPIVPGVGPSAYSNVFMTKSIEVDGYWEIQITKNYLAWCGTAPKAIAPGVVVSLGNRKPVELGQGAANGTTVHMYNNDGEPAFEQTTEHTAQEGCYKIVAKPDFDPNQNFLMGMAGLDSSGKVKPLASWAAKPNMAVNIQPVERFYLGAFDFTEREVVKASSVSTQCAKIFFDENPGKLAAIVTQNRNNSFTVRYENKAAFIRRINALKQKSVQTAHYKKQLQIAQALHSTVDVSNADEEYGYHGMQQQQRGMTGGDLIRYECLLTWTKDPAMDQKQSAATHMTNSMAKRNYDYEHHTLGERKLTVYFSHYPPSREEDAVLDWEASVDELPRDLRIFVTQPEVHRLAGQSQGYGYAGRQSRYQSAQYQDRQYQDRQYQDRQNQNRQYQSRQSPMYQSLYEKDDLYDDLYQDNQYQSRQRDNQYQSRQYDNQYHSRQYDNQQHDGLSLNDKYHMTRRGSLGRQNRLSFNEPQRFGRYQDEMNGMGYESLDVKKQRARQLLRDAGINLSEIGVDSMNVNGVGMNGIY